MDSYNIYKTLLIALYATALVVFICLYFITAPYGRHFNRSLKISIKARAGWFFMEVPSFLVFLFCFLLRQDKINIITFIFLVFWLFHYFHRSFVYPFIMKGGYKSFPFLLVLFAVIFNSANSYVNGYYLFFLSNYSISWLRDPRFIVGVSLFLLGAAINIQSDHILRNLRKPGETAYKIPKKGMFKYVSNPNYFGEIIEWSGWAIATWSLAGLAFALFTIANLMPRASANHRWYFSHFPDYPKERKALIPFIY